MIKDTLWARRLGFKASSALSIDHAAEINLILTPSVEEIEKARRLIEAFETALSAGQARALLDGALVEKPAVRAARRLLERAILFEYPSARRRV